MDLEARTPDRVAMLSGSWPPDICGVGDYTQQLCSHLEAAGVSIETVVERIWKLSKLREIVERVKGSGADILHIQYPTLSYKASLLPHFIPFLVAIPTVVTLHEFKYSHWLRKISAFFFGIRARALIFPNQEDLDSFVSTFPFFQKKCTRVRLGSNIPRIDGQFSRKEQVVYFGIIRAGKGIEDFLKAARAVMEQTGTYQFILIGGNDRNNPDYSESIIEQATSCGVEVTGPLSSDDVSRTLQESRYAYLPYPGGPTERRCSLFSALDNGCVVLSSPIDGDSDLSGSLIELEWPESLPGTLQKLEEQPRIVEKVRSNASELMKRHAWNCIANEHKSLYGAIQKKAHKKLTA